MTIADTFTFAQMVFYYLTNWKVNSNNFIFFSLIKNVAKSSGEPITKPSLSLSRKNTETVTGKRKWLVKYK